MTYEELISLLRKEEESNPGFLQKEARTEIGKIVGIFYNSYSKESCLGSRVKLEIEERSRWEVFESIFTLSGVPILEHYVLKNQYGPDEYLKYKAENSWYLIKTPKGLIEIGWRKKVISITWDFIDYIVTKDEVTKDKNCVHAWSYEKAIEYLRELWKEANKEE